MELNLTTIYHIELNSTTTFYPLSNVIKDRKNIYHLTILHVNTCVNKLNVAYLVSTRLLG